MKNRLGVEQMIDYVKKTDFKSVSNRHQFIPSQAALSQVTEQLLSRLEVVIIEVNNLYDALIDTLPEDEKPIGRVYVGNLLKTVETDKNGFK